MSPTPTLADQIVTVLGQPIARLIDLIAQHAQAQSISLYMVGGIVRDLFLKRPSIDLDFVIEDESSGEATAEAIAAVRFAESLQSRYGGTIHRYRPFGTATWTLENVSFDTTGLPAHVDFATARGEFYEHPAALPTVYNGSIKLDLLRRDFTINTLAIQLSPAASSERILDFYGGLSDLHAGLIRVLHDLSFVDDPTRILRAVRFERRLGFTIEPHTAQWIDTALPILRRITGERIRNELALLLAEPDPGTAFLLLQSRAILTAIHPAFVVSNHLPARLDRARTTPPPWSMPPPDPTDLAWCVLLTNVPLSELADLCARLLFSKALADSVFDTARLVQQSVVQHPLTEPELPPSRVVAALDGIGDLALFAAWLVVDTDNPENSSVRERIRRYAGEWRSVRPTIDGLALRARGLKPGPCYARILARLRAARLDGEIKTDLEESRLLDRLLEEGICHDGAQ